MCVCVYVNGDVIHKSKHFLSLPCHRNGVQWVWCWVRMKNKGWNSALSRSKTTSNGGPHDSCFDEECSELTSESETMTCGFTLSPSETPPAAASGVDRYPDSLLLLSIT